jgi:Phosphatidate phosphatase APP1, catalytic domain
MHALSFSLSPPLSLPPILSLSLSLSFPPILSLSLSLSLPSTHPCVYLPLLPCHLIPLPCARTLLRTCVYTPQVMVEREPLLQCVEASGSAYLMVQGPHGAVGRVYLSQPTSVPPLVLVSDIDDTIKVSNVSKKELLLENTFFREFRAVPGMSSLYRRWARQRPLILHYVRLAFVCVCVCVYVCMLDDILCVHVGATAFAWRCVYISVCDSVKQRRRI